MSEKKNLNKEATKAPEAKEAKTQVQAMPPDMDVFEDETGITLLADMPGVSRDKLEISVDKGTLVIEGESSINMPAGMEALYADVRQTHYRRSFTLSRELDTDKVEANLKNGVLMLRIPRHESLQPRKIEIRS